MPKNIIFFDRESTQNLRPFTFLRPIAEIRVGITLIREKWEQALTLSGSWIAEPHLSKKYPTAWSEETIFINGGALPNEDVVSQVSLLEGGESLWSGETLIAFVGDKSTWEAYQADEKNAFARIIKVEAGCKIVTQLYHIYVFNGETIKNDFLIKAQSGGAWPLSATVKVIGNLYSNDGTPNIYLEQGAKAEHCIINVTDGPVYIGKEAEVMEGSMLRGPIALCDHAKINMGAKIYGGTTIGPFCKVGGEVHNSVLMAYSNKGHDGFLGHAVIGEWCNIGADTNNSNLRNDYGPVKLWNYEKESFQSTGQQFCGLILGDHSKCGINTMFNTGTVVGIASNIVGAGYPRNFIPSFVIGGASGFKTFQLVRASPMAERMMARRGIAYDGTEQEIMEYVFSATNKYRKGLI